MFAKLEIAMLQKFLEAEMEGRPITHAALGLDVQGSTFQDLWAQGEITIKGQTGLVMFFSPDSEYVLTDSGKHRLASLGFAD